MNDDIAALVERLEGIYRVPVKDGLGAVGGGEEPDNPDEFVRRFPTAPVQLEAASTIHTLVAENELTAELASCRRLYNDLYSGEFAEIATKLRVSDALLREAVEVMRDLLDWADDYQRWGTTPTHDALSPARAFLATMEKPHDP